MNWISGYCSLCFFKSVRKCSLYRVWIVAETPSARVVKRESTRLRTSFEAAKKDGYRRFIMFLHFPPTSILEDDSPFTRMAEEYGAEQVIYAHSHGESRFYDSIHGEKNGVLYSLASGDYLKWEPLRIL